MEKGNKRKRINPTVIVFIYFVAIVEAWAAFLSVEETPYKVYLYTSLSLVSLAIGVYATILYNRQKRKESQ
ncbi:hypothetical protein N781_06025 [Pontibacillus halophilus JSM 076056 = DSM 19796]|uniref:Uncharacterized protein n=1 Tax=Pontibacillus halophilus JSM 076056 = DSM 19796 TaxID=1385510 RepID=A0A0A5GIK0_9BACI|nr:hypothetical protein [Pontibacillus halophilus]KGX90960.1 hypothetical protein N781_06025 [Pontibacillus halophilus JSM 076056 = DSM 19796]